MDKEKINHNFWYVSCLGDYASGMWCPFETKEEAIDYVKKGNEKTEIIFEGLDEWGDHTIKFSNKSHSLNFDTYNIMQRKDDEILIEEYIE